MRGEDESGCMHREIESEIKKKRKENSKDVVSRSLCCREIERREKVKVVLEKWRSLFGEGSKESGGGGGGTSGGAGGCAVAIAVVGNGDGRSGGSGGRGITARAFPFCNGPIAFLIGGVWVILWCCRCCRRLLSTVGCGCGGALRNRRLLLLLGLRLRLSLWCWSVLSQAVAARALRTANVLGGNGSLGK